MQMRRFPFSHSFRCFSRKKPNAPWTRSSKELRRLGKSLDEAVSARNAQLLKYDTMYDFFERRGWRVMDDQQLPQTYLARQGKAGDAPNLSVLLAFNAKGPNLFKPMLQKILSNAPKNFPPEIKSIMEQTVAIAREYNEQDTHFSLPAVLVVNLGGAQTAFMGTIVTENGYTVETVCFVAERVAEQLDAVLNKKSHENMFFDFDSFSEELQSSLMAYLSNLGLDRDFCLRVSQLAGAKNKFLDAELSKELREVVKNK